MRFEDARQDEMAKKILHYSRRYITQAAPIMLQPIYAMEQRRSEQPGPMATNGRVVWYDPEWVIKSFRKDRSAPARELLHLTLHCLLGHLPQRAWAEHKAIFDVVTDFKVSELIHMLDPELISHHRLEFWEDAPPTARAIGRLEQDPALARRIIKNVVKNELRLDDHERWNERQAEGQAGIVIQVSNGGEAADGGQGPGGHNGQTGPDWAGMLEELLGQAEKGQWGSLAGMLREELEPAEENSVSYAAYLEQFAKPKERLLLDPDSFDPRWYHIGIEQYGNIPLLEPAELSEPPVPDDIVLALDTSGSCSGEVCRQFLRESMNLLRDISMGAAGFRVLALQCDTAVQAELMLETPDQIDTFLQDFTPQGFGGTDFCPVFERVAQRQAEGALPRVSGLVYLSDGYGDFPEKDPGYPVTFLMLNENGDDDPRFAPQLPDWVSALWLNTRDFTLKEAKPS